MVYDRYGNRTDQNQTTGNPPTNHIQITAPTNRITGDCYDANGNLLAESAPPCPSPTYTYDARITIVNYLTAEYTYDGNGLRVKKVSGSTTTVYVFSGSKVIAEYDNGAAVGSPSRKYIYSGSALLAKIDSSGTKYYHQDHLSNRLVTDSSGNTVAQLGHYPFGESWYNSTGDKLLFTSYERDSESGNDYALARYHVNRLGRFGSPDPLSGGVSDPQSLDRYVYTRDDPIDFVDPRGLYVAGPHQCDNSVVLNCVGGGGGDGTDSGWWEMGLLEFAFMNTGTIDDPSFDNLDALNLLQGPDLGPPSSLSNLPKPLGGPLPQPPPPCILNIRINNRAGVGAGTLGNAEDQIKSLFGAYVGVNFVSSGSSDYTLNVANASASDSDLGHQNGFLFFQFTPVVHPNNIAAQLPGIYSLAYNQIMGTVGPHELLHRMGIGDLPYNASSPTDLMSLDHNPQFWQVLGQNMLGLTPNEALKLQKKCLQKHPE